MAREHGPLRRATPSGRPAELPLRAGEKVLATARDRAGRLVAGSAWALFVPGDATGPYRRLAWDAVDVVSYDEQTQTLRVREVAPLGARPAEHVVELAEPTALVSLAHERVRATIAVDQEVELAGGGRVRVRGRRPADGGEWTWEATLGRDLDPHDDAVLARARAALEEVRRQTGPW